MRRRRLAGPALALFVLALTCGAGCVGVVTARPPINTHPCPIGGCAHTTTTIEIGSAVTVVAR